MVRADRRGKGSGPEVPMSGKELSSASAEAKEANISEGSLGGGPSRNLFLYGRDAGVEIHAKGRHPSLHGFVRGHQ